MQNNLKDEYYWKQMAAMQNNPNPYQNAYKNYQNMYMQQGYSRPEIFTDKDGVTYNIENMRDWKTMTSHYYVRDSNGKTSRHEFDERTSHYDALRYAVEKHQRLIKTHPDYVHSGPSNKELQNPAVRNAWEELQLIRRLAGAGGI